MGSALSLKSCLVDESLQMFDKVFNLYMQAHFETKCCLASWCVYIVCRQAGLPITSHYISQVTGYPVYKVYQYHSELLEKLDIQLIHQDITELIETTLKLELARDVICSSDVKEKTKEIILLCKDLWLIEGRNPHAAILSAFFIAWQSEDFAGRKKASLSKICKKRSLAVLCKKRFVEFRETLCKLAQCIPWVTDVRAENLPYYIGDILRYQNSLVIDVMRKAQCESDCASEETDLYQGNHFLSQAAGVAKQTVCSDSMTTEHGEKPSDIAKDQQVPHPLSLNLERCQCDKLCEKLEENKRANVDVPSRDPEARKQNIEVECIFTPPAYKKARRKSIDCETIQEFIQSSRDKLN